MREIWKLLRRKGGLIIYTILHVRCTARRGESKIAKGRAEQEHLIDRQIYR